jgi:replicative DNA helicase
VKAAEAKAGQKIRLLCVDYLGRMKGTGKDAYEKISEIAKGLKNVAKECHMAVIVVVQLNRTGGKGTVEVEMDMARDSGQIEEAADYAIGMWKASGRRQRARQRPSGQYHHPGGDRHGARDGQLLPGHAEGPQEPQGTEGGPRSTCPHVPRGRDAV